MRKHLHRSIATLVAAVMCLSGLALVAVAAFTWADTETRYYSDAGTGDINIKIDVYRLDGDGNEQWVGGNDYNENEEDASVDFGKVMPGQTVSYITKITNVAESAWIRIDPEYLSETNIEWLTDDNLTIADKGTNGNKGVWEKHGEYYYYTEPVATRDVVTFTTAVHIPSDLTDDTIPTKGFHIYLNADAVQTEHFTPIEADDDGKAAGYKFSDDPWFGTLIQECYHYHMTDEHYTDGIYTGGGTGDNTFSVRFDEGATGFVKVPQDFFSGWARLMPGDSANGEVSVGNNYGLPVIIYFHVEAIDENHKLYDSKLLDALQIEIKSVGKDGEETTIYTGPLSGTTEPVSLGQYEPNVDVTTLKYTVSFDTKYDNEYTLRDTETIWVFSTQILYDMPTVGGVGTMWFMIAGSALTLMGAALLIILNKKKNGGEI